MESLTTLSELSARLCSAKKASDIRKTSRKIQNWVTDGIVQPVSGKNEGRGVHRKYDELESFKIAVLLEATRYWLPGTVLQMLSGLFDDSRPAKQDLKIKLGNRKKSSSKLHATKGFNQLLRRARSNKTAYLSIIPSETDSGIQVGLSIDEKFIHKNSSAIVLNLTKILSDLVPDKT